MTKSADRPVLARDDHAGPPGTVAYALQDALRWAIAHRRGYCSWDVDQASWVVMLHSPEEHDFYGRTLEEALAKCLGWLMTPELGIRQFRI